MANKTITTQRKQELANQLAKTRESITQSRKELKEKLQIKPLMSKLIWGKPTSLFAGSAIAGLGAAIFLRRPRKVKKTHTSTKLILFSWVLSLMKPAAKAWLVERAKSAAAQSSTGSTTPRPPQQY